MVGGFSTSPSASLTEALANHHRHNSVSEAAEQRGWRLLVATCSYLPLVAATLYSHTHCFFLVHIFISSSVAGGRVSNDLSLEMGGS